MQSAVGVNSTYPALQAENEFYQHESVYGSSYPDFASSNFSRDVSQSSFDVATAVSEGMMPSLGLATLAVHHANLQEDATPNAMSTSIIPQLIGETRMASHSNDGKRCRRRGSTDFLVVT